MASGHVDCRFDSSSLKDPLAELEEFTSAHGEWLANVRREDGVILSLHPAHIDNTLRLFSLDAIAEAAERDFARLCDRHHAIGVCNSRFIRYSLLRPPLPWPPSQDLNVFLQLGWTKSDIACVRNLSDPTAKINQRLRASAGRVISMPAFLAAKARIHDLWQELPPQIQPGLPLARSVKLAATSGMEIEPAPDLMSEFIAEFDRFCDEWHLLGMTTWLLPHVRGPHWVPEIAPEDALRRGDLTVTTPWHFPVLAEDGLGRVLEAEHRRQAAERGVEDTDSWQTYANLLDVYFWENVLLPRYSKQQRAKQFRTQMEMVQADILGLSVGRVQKLHKWLRALQSGKLKSLRGKH
jgi:hypothetical protein